MAKHNSERVGSPRLNQVERLLHRFYEPLVLLSILDPTRGSERSSIPFDLRSPGIQSQWRRLLDGLSWLCDYERGGETVSAVAAESTCGGSKFWLAAKNKRALPHLQSILQLLELFIKASFEHRNFFEEEIFEKSVKFARDRIKNYANYLRRFVDEAIGKSDPSSLAPRTELLNELDTLLSVRLSHCELCILAHKFKNLHILDQIILETTLYDGSSPWSTVRHYIGRLGSWSRVAKSLLDVTRLFPQHIENFTIEYLEFPAATIRPAADAKTTIKSALGRMLPKDEQFRVEDLFQEIIAMRDLDIPTKFIGRYANKKLQPRIHAETFLLEHFYFDELKFVGNDRYIGCSKASCYCCNLYIRHHPGNFVLRPCHGNLWPNWSPPLTVTKDDSVTFEHNLSILNDMTKHIRRDVLQDIESKIPPRKRVPDSSTGLSA